jgi:hypothetical protein
MECLDCLRFCVAGMRSNRREAANRTAKSTAHDEQIDQIAKRAEQIVDAIRSAEKPGKELEFKLNEIVLVENWTESLAELVLRGVENAVRDVSKISVAFRDAMEQAATEAYEFAKEHPVYCTIIALGILVLLAPWAIEALGFGEMGPIEGIATDLR